MADISRGENFHHLRRQMFGGDDGYPSAMTTIIFNESGEDINFRFETDTNANAIVLDAGLFGGVGQLSIGAAAQATATAFARIDNPATTSVADQPFAKLLIGNAAATTVPAGTTAMVASLRLEEPNITATGTVTEAATLYAVAAPTEGSNNYTIFSDAGLNRFDGDVVIGGGATAGATLDVADTVVTSGTSASLLVTGAAHTGMTASTEVNFARINLGQTVEWAAGAITTQRAIRFDRPTYAFVGASTVTTASTLDIDGPPSAGTNATLTSASTLRLGGASTQVSAAGLIYNTLNIPAHTLTLTGTTQVTSSAIANIGIGQLTITDASAVTVDQAASIYVADAPVAAGSVTLSRPYSLWIDGGRSRFDDSILLGATAVGTGTPTNVFVIANGTVPTSSPTDSVTFYSTDNTAGNTIPSFYCEGTDVIATGQGDSASSVRVRMRINGTVVTLLAI